MMRDHQVPQCRVRGVDVASRANNVVIGLMSVKALVCPCKGGNNVWCARVRAGTMCEEAGWAGTRICCQREACL